MKETAEILGLASPTKATQAMQPAWVKVAKHFREKPATAMKQLILYVEMLENMDEQETIVREAMLNGTLNRNVLHR